ncbi:hypothetical protein OEB99_07145 [Actinotalea sp. M2MS4P-6]|uniref:hypothetical protein n=1 Tax=Actinotalea sp. M2MS4P-6 TaxID=2983762 RepID=UPI0021E3D7DA|nr:hypothetical protein [Actinotalea sp. M2MS4P-6]MCV2394077.1 hypothetical protein [Actinotalea sp. M2MS4P-6]
MRKRAIALLTGAALTIGSVALAGPAAAASDVQCASAVGSGSAFSYRYINVKNSCSRTITVRLDIANANDSGCYAISANSTEQLRYNRLWGTFRSIKDC